METLKILGILGGICGIAVGGLMFFAGSMSDAPVEGEAAGARGCVTFVLGLAVLVGCILGLVL